MPQSPLLTDQLQIEPGSGQTLLLNRDSATGSLKFLDAVITGGVLLKDLVGIRNIAGVYIVGRAGTGAPYTSITQALAGVPETSSSASPSLILVFPGTYQENLILDKDGVCVVGLGGVTIQNSGSSDTLLVKASLSTVPQSLLLKGLTLVNDVTGYACVRVQGADSFASATATITAAPLTSGDTLVVNGVTLTGLPVARTPGANNFNSTVSTPSSMAIEIAAAINDPLNSFASFVTATPSGTAILIEANVAGSAGNAYTLTTTSAGISLSGAFFTGGSSAGSLVGVEGINLEGCSLAASAAGGFNLYADTVNLIRITGGSFSGSSSSAQIWATNTALLKVSGVEGIEDVQVSYDASADQPSITTSEYSFQSCTSVGDVLSNLLGEGSLSFFSVPSIGNVTAGGDRTLLISSCSLGDLTLSDSVASTLQNSTRGSSSTASGTPTLAENSTGTVSFTASSSEIVTFSVEQPDANYSVLLDLPSVGTSAAITVRTSSGFTVTTSGIYTGDVYYNLIRL
jgi:hypothetical protein